VFPLVPKNPHPDLDALGDTAERNPAEIFLVPTSRCNTRCIYCAHYDRSFGEDMREETYQRIADSLLADAQRVDFTGDGEAFLSKIWDRMFEDCLRRNKQICVVTNGILLAKNDAFLDRIVRNDVRLSISIDGACSETFNFSRPHIPWESMLEVLRRLKKAADRAGREKRFRMIFVYVPMKRNIGGLPDLVRLAATYGASEICVLPLTREEENERIRGQSLRDAPERVSAAFIQALSLSARLGVNVRVPPSFRSLILEGGEQGGGLKNKALRVARSLRIATLLWRRHGARHFLSRVLYGFGPRAQAGVGYCRFPWTSTFLRVDGTVAACCVMRETLGDINGEEWPRIWNGPLYRNLRRTVHSWNPTASCRRCSFPSGINGGDEKQYDSFFSRFKSKSVSLDSPHVAFGDGFHDLEFREDGRPSHCWMGRRGILSIPMGKGAKFLRIGIFPRLESWDPNPGQCRINGGNWGPFDDTCAEIHIPVDGIAADRITVEMEMESVRRVEPDPRDLGLAVREIQYLC